MRLGLCSRGRTGDATITTSYSKRCEGQWPSSFDVRQSMKAEQGQLYFLCQNHSHIGVAPAECLFHITFPSHPNTSNPNCQVQSPFPSKMPTRAQFFAAPPAQVEAGATCRICYDDLSLGHPLRLPCDPEHTFCKDCITPWLLRECKCMYMCATRPWDAAAWTAVDPSVIAKTAAQLNTFPQETFGVEQSKLNESRVMKWQNYLVKRAEPSGTGIPVIMLNEERTEVEGPGWIIPSQLLLSTVSLANAIPLLVANSQERAPYTVAEKQDWQRLVKAFVGVLPTSPAIVKNVESIPRQLRQLTEGKLSADGVEVSAMSFLQADNVRFEDFELLLEYLALTVFVAPAPESLAGLARACESVKQIPLLAKFALTLML